MTLNETIDYELEKLDYITSNFIISLQVSLLHIRHGNPVYLNFSKQDRYRLLTLKIWMEKYRVSLDYILRTITSWTDTFSQKHFRQSKRHGLGVKVSTFCGKKSQEILERQIQKDFPNGENKLEYIQREQTRILEWEVRRLDKQQLQEDGIKTSDQMKKSLLDYSDPRFFVRHYRRRMKHEGRTREHIIREMRKYNYRGNPFREETV